MNGKKIKESFSTVIVWDSYSCHFQWSLFNFAEAFVCRIVNLRLLWPIFFAECNSQGDSNRPLMYKKTKLAKVKATMSRKISMKLIFTLTFSQLLKKMYLWNFVFVIFPWSRLLNAIYSTDDWGFWLPYNVVPKFSPIFNGPDASKLRKNKQSRFLTNLLSC